MNNIVELKKVIEKYFKDEKTLYFHSSDAHQIIEGDTYLSFSWRVDKIELYFGGDNGDFCLTVTDNPEKLEALIKNLIW